MKKSQVYTPHRIRRKKSILKNRFFRQVILFSILAISVFYLLIFSATFQIENIIISGEEKVSKQGIKGVVENQIAKKILFFPTKSIFLANFKKIREDILNNFPTIAEIEMRRGFPAALNVVVTERLGTGVFCQGQQCFLLDSEGIIFDPHYLNIGVGASPHYPNIGVGAGEIFEENPKLLKIESRAHDIQLKPGDSVIEKEKLTQILEIISKLKQDLKISCDLAEIVSGERLNVKTNEGWEIYFNPTEDINWQITELDLLLQNKIPSERREILEYIDLRFSRVYYRYR